MSDAIEEVPPEIWTDILDYAIRRAPRNPLTSWRAFNAWCVECARTCKFFAVIILPWVSEVPQLTAAAVERLACWHPCPNTALVSGHTALLVHTARILPTFTHSLTAFVVPRQHGATTALILLACAYAALHANVIVQIITSSQDRKESICQALRGVVTSMNLLCSVSPDTPIELPHNSVILVRRFYHYIKPWNPVQQRQRDTQLVLIEDPQFMDDCVDANFLAKAKRVVTFFTPTIPTKTQDVEGDHPWSSLAPCECYSVREIKNFRHGFYRWLNNVQYFLQFKLRPGGPPSIAEKYCEVITT